MRQPPSRAGAFHSVRENGPLSFSRLIYERFSDELKEAVLRHLRSGYSVPEQVRLSSVAVLAYDAEYLRYEARFSCAYRRFGRKCREDLLARASCRLADAFRTTDVESVLPLPEGYRPAAALPDDLIPRLSAEELERTASELLSEFAPETLKGSAPVDPDAFAEKIGLTVREVPFDPDRSVFGKIFLRDTEAVLADPRTKMLRIQSVKAGTVLLNGRLCRARRDITVLHECAHWILHRPAFLLLNVRCPACTETAQADGDALRFLERQADALAARLLLPRKAVISVAGQASRQEAVLRLCSFFHASRRLSEIRLSELGYGIPDPPSGGIPAEELLRRFPLESGLRKQLSGNGCRFRNGAAVLNAFRADRDRFPNLPEVSLCRSGHVPFDPLTPAAPYAGIRELSDHARAEAKALQDLPSGFSDTLAEYMKRKGCTAAMLTERCGISERQITRLRNSDFETVPVRTAVALCVGLRLPPVLSFDLIRKAGIYLNTTREHTAYTVILCGMTDRPVSECDAFLLALGLRPLTGQDKTH